jgi:hypothetical protein
MSKRTGPQLSETAIELALIAEERLGEIAAGGERTVDDVLNELTEMTRLNLVRAHFDALQPIQRYQALLAAYGDATIRAALEGHRRIAHENAEMDISLARLRSDGRRRRMVDTSNVPPDTSLQLDLHATTDFKNFGNHDELYEGGAIPDWSLALKAANGGSYRVIESVITEGSGDPTIPLEPHQII